MQNSMIENCLPNTLYLSREESIKQKKQQRASNNYKKLKLKFIVPQVSLNWKQLSKGILSESIHSLSDIGDQFKVLFNISSDIFWRNKAFHIQMLIQQIHNGLIQSGNISIYCKLPKFQQKLRNICCLKDKNISANMTLLINEGCLDDQILSLIVVQLIGYEQINSKVFWVLTLLDKVHPQCLNKLFKQQYRKDNQLPFLSILANYVTYCTQQSILLMLSNQLFMNLINQIFERCNSNIFSRQAHLILNNIMSRKGECFYRLISNNNLIQMLLKQQSQQTWWTLLILLQMSKTTGNSLINASDCLRISKTLPMNQSIYSIFQKQFNSQNKFNQSQLQSVNNSQLQST